MLAAARRRLADASWFQRTVLVGAVLAVAWAATDGLATLEERLLRDGLLLLALPLAFGLRHGRRLGWTVNRAAVRNAVLLALFVTPFYVVGSTLPSVRSFYPLWGLDTLAPAPFLRHSLLQFLLVVAGETYYRGLLCVGIRERGPWVILISPALYAVHHLGMPPIEAALSAPTDALFGAVDYQAGSILPSVVAHGFGLLLLDYLVLREPLLDPERTQALLEWLPLPL